MPKPYFKFKQFQVFHDRCAMKVGTDSVLLGAWANVTGVQTILDVGTGCGLLALMMAQRSDAVVDAVEIEPNAAQQARENVAQSPWAQRIEVHSMAIQEFVDISTRRYDLIVSNPPYFADSLKAETQARSRARHNDSLRQEELLAMASALLTTSGRMAVIYPTEQAAALLRLASQSGWSCCRKLNVFPKHTKPISRILLELSRKPSVFREQDLVIEAEARHDYTNEYANLTRDFYLRF